MLIRQAANLLFIIVDFELCNPCALVYRIQGDDFRDVRFVCRDRRVHGQETDMRLI